MATFCALLETFHFHRTMHRQSKLFVQWCNNFRINWFWLESENKMLFAILCLYLAVFMLRHFHKCISQYSESSKLFNLHLKFFIVFQIEFAFIFKERAASEFIIAHLPTCMEVTTKFLNTIFRPVM